jgi:hypothetical protein
LEKEKAKRGARRFSSDSNLTPEDHERITRAFKHVLREIQNLRKSQISAYGHLRELKKRVRELEKRVWRFIEPS